MLKSFISAESLAIGAGFDLNGRRSMTDPHQVNAIISTAICDARKDHPEQRIDPEEAKQMAKCIIDALTDAGLKVCAREEK
jgi:hypothetical protein